MWHLIPYNQIYFSVKGFAFKNMHTIKYILVRKKILSANLPAFCFQNRCLIGLSELINLKLYSDILANDLQFSLRYSIISQKFATFRSLKGPVTPVKFYQKVKLSHIKHLRNQSLT